MKPGMEAGQQAEYQCAVTKEMFPCFEGEVIHPVYSTVSMVHHMEWTARKLILPYLEENEEGMGTAVIMKHLAPAAEGSVITLRAAITKITGSLVTAEIKVYSETRLIGEGSVVQIILPKNEIARIIDNSKNG
ncbi:hotdog domain-containing protein [Bacillus sp. MUM 13]|uniref:thioesterase family protein n=1 Tax=Bacillus sp. MUM 13 TaxID=1678001 RepID=UPI0008F558C0|nr:hotdog domain-containing protein [Bacillus sp. MUM 13]OIK14922.1 thioesterase [Bacillus sp. MUM 13]